MTAHILIEFVKNCPTTTGVYIIRNEPGRPIYIGKARSLKARLTSHFNPDYNPDSKEKLIRRDAVKIDLVETATEAEALLLEASLVRQYKPKYNIALRDDRSYPFLKITDEKYPRLLLVRGRKSDGSKYFGPFTNVKLLRQSISILRRLFPMRTCNPLPKSVCLMYHIGQCQGPCEEKVGVEEYKTLTDELGMFLEGKRDVLICSLTKRMSEASQKKNYELAKTYRDQINALVTVSERKAPVGKPSQLLQLQRILKLDRYPARIECFDISNFAGSNTVASMVVFENGKPKKSDYRKFKIKTVEGINDYDSMREVVSRRYQRLLNENKPLPDLVFIDGGKGHLACAKEELNRLNLADLDIISIAKKQEQIYKPGRLQPYIFPQDSPVLQLMRSIRDEAHRFAITFYRQLHAKEMVWSVLDEAPGVGKKRKAIILSQYQTIESLREADAEEIASKCGFGLDLAKKIELYIKSI